MKCPYFFRTVENPGVHDADFLSERLVKEYVHEKAKNLFVIQVRK